MSNARLCAITLLLYVPAWFLPAAHTSGDLFGGTTFGGQAFLFAASPLLGNDVDGGFALLAWMVASAASNLLLVAALAAVCWRPQALSRRVAWALVAATAINAYWMLLPDMRTDLRYGYYLWLASFVLATLTVLLAIRRRDSSAAPQALTSAP